MSVGVASFLYFAYGRHLDATALQKLAPGAEFLGVGKLESHGLSFLPSGRGFTVLPASGESVFGGIWVVPATFLEAMDQFHEVSLGTYGQCTRRILSPAGPRVGCTLYLAPGVEASAAVGDPEVLRTVVEAARRTGLSPGAIARIERCGRVAQVSR